MLFLISLVAVVLSIIALNKVSVLEGRLRRTREFAEQLQADIKAMKVPVGEVTATPTPVALPIQEAAAGAESLNTAPETAIPEPAASETKNAAESVARKPNSGGLEQALAGRWFVVIGGIAVALGGLLFVKYAHDNGLIPPILRVLLGYMFAGALVASSEFVRRNRLIQDLVPAALSAAGLVIAFGVTYAAYALYNLISPALCFPLLVAIGLAALWLSRRQGPLIAALGLVGSYAAPALVPSDHPSAWGFFAYLAVIVAASLYELRLRPWWWLGFAAIGGALVWSMLWLNGGLFAPGHVLPTSLFAFAVSIFSAVLPRGLSLLKDDTGSIASPKSLTPPLQIALAGLAAGALILGSTVWNSAYSTLSLTLFALGMAAVAALGWLKPHRNVAAGLAAAFTLLVFMVWPNVSTFVPAFDERGFWVLVPQLIEPQRFVKWVLAAGLAFSALGTVGTLRKPTIHYWDALAAGSAILFLFGAWAKADFALGDVTWAAFGVAACAAMAFSVWTLRSRSTDKKANEAVWLLSASAVLLALFAFDRTLDNIWYTLAVALLAAACAYASRLIDSRAPASISVALATLAALRLFVGREFWSEPEGFPLGAHWPLYGYGLPAAIFWWSSRQVISPRDDRAKVALEGISLGLLISLVSLELRILMGGGITADNMSVLELGSHVTAWLGAAFGLAYRQKYYSSFISRWGTIALTAASCLALLALLTIRNPALTGDVIQGGTIFNGLWLAYLLPAGLLAAILNRAEWLSRPPQRTVLASLAMVLVMAFATLMVKRWYQGPRLVPEFISDAESYTVSLVWLMMGLAAFVAGLRIDRQSVRFGGLIVLILTVLKVFILDLAGLTGLWRIASLMGLGFCLIGIGWLYTRFIARKSLPAEAAESAGKPADPA